MMDDVNQPKSSGSLASSPARFEIVFADDPQNPLALVTPPIDDIQEMVNLSRSVFSLKADGGYARILRVAAEVQLDGLLAKSGRFSLSSTFNNRIANLHSVLGEFELEERSARAAYEANSSEVMARKLADATLRAGDRSKAESMLLEIAAVDSGAALRLAAFEIRKGNFQAAESWIKTAVELQPWGYAERLFQGALCLVQGRYREAVGILKMALDDRPNSSVVYSNLGFAYLGEAQYIQANKSLRRAVALDPFNRTALFAYADLASRMGCDGDVVSALRYYIEFEQKDASAWERLARSLFRLEMYDDALWALKSQGAISPTAGVWNNIGVAYSRKRDAVRSMQSFKQALQAPSSAGLGLDLLIVKNSAALVSSAGRYEEVLAMTNHVVGQDVGLELARDLVASEIYSIHMHALMRTGMEGSALSLAEKLLEVNGIARPLLRWIASTESAYRGLHRENDDLLNDLLDRFMVTLGADDFREVSVSNNIAFAFAEIGRLDDAARCLRYVSSSIHAAPYPTATLGLINMRRGNFDRGVQLYEEAIHLATTRSDKARIRQKMNLELAIRYEGEPKRSLRFLEKVVDEKLGESVLCRRAVEMRRRLKVS